MMFPVEHAARLRRAVARAARRLSWGCWRGHGATAWEEGHTRLRCTRCWAVVWDAHEARQRLERLP